MRAFLPPSSPSRRRFLRQASGLFAAAGFAAQGASALAAVDYEFWERPRVLRLVRPETGDRFESLYWTGRGLHTQGYNELCWLLRDPHERTSVQMDVRLLDLLYGIQGYLTAATGLEDALVITDGYRTARTNAAMREQGLPAARQSLHMHAQAADIKVARLTPAQLAGVARYFDGGGVGVYRDGHVHVDTGRVRVWQG